MAEVGSTHAGWIGVDLDGTLAHYDGWQGDNHIGRPIPKMMRRVKRWVAEGKTVKIFTARMAMATEEDRHEVRYAIHRWCERHGLPRLEITCSKDFGMIELWDDRAVQVEPNTGQRADGAED